jgi:plastocyanin
MTRSISCIAFATSLALLAFTNASTHTVTVGDGGLKFTPNSTIASVGDVVEFHYYPKNHSVVQSGFSNPCMSTSGFFSGYIPSAAGEAVSQLPALGRGNRQMHREQILIEYPAVKNLQCHHQRYQSNLLLL